MTLVTTENAFLLAEVREALDGPFNKKPLALWNEVQAYAAGLEGRRAYVIKEGNAVVGYVQCKLYEILPLQGFPPIPEIVELGHITRIGVRKEFRRGGIGEWLLFEAEKWLRAQGKPGSWVEFFHTDHYEFQLYSTAGYLNAITFPDLEDPPRQKIVAWRMW